MLLVKWYKSLAIGVVSVYVRISLKRERERQRVWEREREILNGSGERLRGSGAREEGMWNCQFCLLFFFLPFLFLCFLFFLVFLHSDSIAKFLDFLFFGRERERGSEGEKVWVWTISIGTFCTVNP